MSAGSASPTDRGSVLPRDKVRALQHTLYRAAKADPGRRFHTLMSMARVIASPRVQRSVLAGSVDRVICIPWSGLGYVIGWGLGMSP